MSDDQVMRAYLIGAAIVWAGIFLASAVVLSGTGQFGRMLPILGGGAVWFVVLVPPLLRRSQQRPGE
ncbi:MAG: hypothetical protein IRY97_10065 [Thermomicrobiaceae bacterium]|nr:hypothetical protein [Thermomicrobiaceae bacterium]